MAGSSSARKVGRGRVARCPRKGPGAGRGKPPRPVPPGPTRSEWVGSSAVACSAGVRAARPAKQPLVSGPAARRQHVSLLPRKARSSWRMLDYGCWPALSVLRLEIRRTAACSRAYSAGPGQPSPAARKEWRGAVKTSWEGRREGGGEAASGCYTAAEHAWAPWCLLVHADPPCRRPGSRPRSRGIDGPSNCRPVVRVVILSTSPLWAALPALGSPAGNASGAQRSCRPSPLSAQVGIAALGRSGRLSTKAPGSRGAGHVLGSLVVW